MKTRRKRDGRRQQDSYRRRCFQCRLWSAHRNPGRYDPAKAADLLEISAIRTCWRADVGAAAHQLVARSVPLAPGYRAGNVRCQSDGRCIGAAGCQRHSELVDRYSGRIRRKATAAAFARWAVLTVFARRHCDYPDWPNSRLGLTKKDTPSLLQYEMGLHPHRREYVV